MLQKLGLGTAQFGLDYAIDTRETRPEDREIARILDSANEYGVPVVDTASRYGTAEQVLGRCLGDNHSFKIVTKTPTYRKESIGRDDAELLVNTFKQSLSLLRRPKVHALITHWAPDLLCPGGERLYDAMLSLQNEGLVDKIGSSVYTADHIDGLMSRYPIEFIQAPVSVLDQRLVRSGHLRLLNEAGVELHARSAFLKGLIFCNVDHLSDHFDSVTTVLRRFRESARQLGLTPLSAALQFLFRLSEIDTVVVGVTLMDQFKEIVDAAKMSIDSLPDFTEFGINDRKILDPNNWPKTVLA